MPLYSLRLWVNVQVCGFGGAVRSLLHNMFSFCKFMLSLGLSLTVLQWLFVRIPALLLNFLFLAQWVFLEGYFEAS